MTLNLLLILLCSANCLLEFGAGSRNNATGEDRFFTKDVLDNGLINEYDGLNGISDEHVRTTKYYSLEGLSNVTFTYSQDILPYNIFYYDAEFYYMGCSSWCRNNMQNIPTGARYCRLCIALYYENTHITINKIKELRICSNILSQPSIKYEPSYNEQKRLEGTEARYLKIDVNNLVHCGYSISDKNVWVPTNDKRYGAAIIPVNHKGIRYDHIHVKSNNEKGAMIAFIKGFNAMANNKVAYCNSIPIVLKSQETSEFDEEIPNDATWVWLYLYNPTSSFRPASVSFSKGNSGIGVVDERVVVLENRESNLYTHNGASKIKVCTWNVGHFDWDGSIKNKFTEDEYQELKVKVRDLLYGTSEGKIRADYISLNEYSDSIQTLDGKTLPGTTHSIVNDFFPYYTNSIIGKTMRYAKNAVFSNVNTYLIDKYIPVTDIHHADKKGITYTSDQYLMESLIRIDNTNVTIVTLHTPRLANRSGDIIDYTVFAREIIKRYSGYSSVVIIGDFNTVPAQLMAFEKAGFKILNKSMPTYNSTIYGPKIIDNVIYKGVDLSDLKVYNPNNTENYPIVNGHCISDHYPLSFSITVGKTL